MKTFTLKKMFAATAAAVALFSATTVMAAPSFTVNQAATGGLFINNALFTGDTFHVSSSELLTFNSNAQTSGTTSGIIRFTDLTATGTPSNVANIVGQSGFYGLYLQFSFNVDYNASKSTGPAGAAGSQYDVSNLLFTLFLDPTGNDVYNSASFAATSSVSDVAGDDRILASGSQIPNVALNTAGFNSAGAATITSFDGFALTPAGSSYFVQPSPFYSLAFTSQTNDAQSVSRSGNRVLISNAGGTVTFQAVPEPTSLALFGIATAGMGLALRRRRKA